MLICQQQRYILTIHLSNLTLFIKQKQIRELKLWKVITMNVTIQSDYFTAADHLELFVNQRVSKLEQYFEGIISAGDSSTG